MDCRSRKEFMMDLLHALGMFMRVAETGSFTAVARETDNSQSGITRQIGMLEEHFGVRLFHRTTRHLSLTDDGENLRAQARNVLAAAEEMEGTHDAPSLRRPGAPAAVLVGSGIRRELRCPVT